MFVCVVCSAPAAAICASPTSWECNARAFVCQGCLALSACALTHASCVRAPVAAVCVCSGTIPATWANNSALQSIVLRRNSIRPPLPPLLQACALARSLALPPACASPVPCCCRHFCTLFLGCACCARAVHFVLLAAAAAGSSASHSVAVVVLADPSSGSLTQRARH